MHSGLLLDTAQREYETQRITSPKHYVRLPQGTADYVKTFDYQVSAQMDELIDLVCLSSRRVLCHTTP